MVNRDKDRSRQFTERLAALVGSAEAAQIKDALAHRGPGTVRFNRRLCAADRLPGPVVPWNAPFGRYWEGDSPPSRSIQYAAGHYYIQEAGAMLAVAAASRVIDFSGVIALDMTAAPGGKATQAAELIDQGYLVANEVMPERRPALVWNINRHRLDNVAVTSIKGRDLAAALPGFFDLVLVDAPCSGEGLFQLGKHALKNWSVSQVLACARRQKTILQEALVLLKPGGYLVYSTCTFSREENEDQVEFLLGKGMVPVPLPDDLPVSPAISENRHVRACARRIFPHRETGAGAFVAVLQKERSDIETCPVTCAFPVTKEKVRQTLPAYLDADRPGAHIYETNGILTLFSRDRLPQFLLDNCFQLGAPLLDKRRGDLPMYGSLHLARPETIIDLDGEQADRYLSGHIPALGLSPGIYFVSFQGLILGPLRVGRTGSDNLLPQPLHRKQADSWR